MRSDLAVVFCLYDNQEDVRSLQNALPGTEYVPCARALLQNPDAVLSLFDPKDLQALILVVHQPDDALLKVVARLQAALPGLAIVVLVSAFDDGQALQVIRSGAQECLPLSEVPGKLLAYMIGAAIERQRAAQGVPHSAQTASEPLHSMNKITERRKTEDQLRYRVEIERMVASLSSDFIRVAPQQTNAAVQRALARIAVFTGVDSAYVCLLPANGATLSLLGEWRAPNLPPRKHEPEALNLEDAPWIANELRQARVVHLAHLADLPPEASADRAFLGHEGVQSLLVVPMSFGETLVGFLGFSRLRRAEAWSSADISLIKLVSEIFVNALERMRVDAALQASEERFRTVVSKAPLILFAFDREARLTFAEGNLLDSVQQRQAGLRGHLAANIAEAVPQFIELSRRALNGETFFATVQTGGLVLDTWYQPLHDQQGAIIGAMGVAIDVTARHQAEAAEHEQRALAEALRDTAATLSRSLEPDRVMNHILDNVGRVVPHDGANIVLRDGDSWRVAYTRGRQKSPALALPGTPATLRQMLETEGPCLLRDTHASPDWQILPGMEWARSYLGMPLRAHNEVVGFLNLDSATPNFFTLRHAERLQAFADQSAVAIQNAQLFERVRRNAQELAVFYRATAFLYTSLLNANNLVEVGLQIAQAVIKEFGTVNCSVVLLQASGELARLVHAGDEMKRADIPLHINGPGLIATCARTGQMVYAPDVNADERYMLGDPRICSELVVPLQTANALIGVLDMQSIQPSAFSEQDRRVLQAFAERAAAALENAQLYDQAIRHTDELEQRVRERTADLDNERAQLKAILDGMGEGVFYGQSDGSKWVLKYANGAFYRMIGYGAEELVGKTIPTYMLADQTAAASTLEAISAALHQTGMWQSEIRMRRKDGSEFDAFIIINRVTGPQGYIGGGVALIRDISQEKTLQEQKDRFIANASHELRTPLTNLKMRLYLLEKQPHLLREHLPVMDRMAGRMQKLVDDLLDVSRFERGVLELDPEIIILQDLIADVINDQQPHAERKALQLIRQVPPVPVIAFVDSGRVTQVLTNLVVNAINYTGEGGRVTLELASTWQGGRKCAVIRVRDTGVGIAPHLLAQIFEPFFRADSSGTKGTGLGLTIAREIVKLHKGKITVESQENVGTTFILTLPLNAPGEVLAD